MSHSQRLRWARRKKARLGLSLTWAICSLARTGDEGPVHRPAIQERLTEIEYGEHEGAAASRLLCLRLQRLPDLGEGTSGATQLRRCVEIEQ